MNTEEKLLNHILSCIYFKKDHYHFNFGIDLIREDGSILLTNGEEYQISITKRIPDPPRI